MGTDCFKIHEVSLADFIFQALLIISSTSAETCDSERRFQNTSVFWCHSFHEYFFHNARSTHFQCTPGEKTKRDLSQSHVNVCISLLYNKVYSAWELQILGAYFWQQILATLLKLFPNKLLSAFQNDSWPPPIQPPNDFMCTDTWQMSSPVPKLTRTLTQTC